MDSWHEIAQIILRKWLKILRKRFMTLWDCDFFSFSHTYHNTIHRHQLVVHSNEFKTLFFLYIRLLTRVLLSSSPLLSFACFFSLSSLPRTPCSTLLAAIYGHTVWPPVSFMYVCHASSIITPFRWLPRAPSRTLMGFHTGITLKSHALTGSFGRIRTGAQHQGVFVFLFVD